MYTKPFEQLDKNSSREAGGKGASLGEMTQAGIPVPPGFVVLSEAFETFLKETDINVEIDSILHGVDPDKMHTIEDASTQIQSLIRSAEMSETLASDIVVAFNTLGAPYVAVRSSATAEDGAADAWAGQLDSFLNVTKDNLLVNVQNCWASLFTPRAIFYRFEKELHATDISVAVVVQKMVVSESAGVAFSVHPVTEDRNQLIIEAAFGLGEAVVSGQVTPDSYVVEKEPRRIIDQNVHTQKHALYRKESGGNVWRELSESEGSAQVLPEEKILELSELVIKIEAHYGFPVDIEWAYEDGVFFIVQSRPITTLQPEKKAVVPTSHFKKAFVRDVTYIMAEAGFYRFNELGEADDNPHGEPIAFCINSGVLEVWVNERSLNWFNEQIIERFENEPTLLQEVQDGYEQKLKRIEAILAREEKSTDTIQELREAVIDIRAENHIMFTAAAEERWPEKVRTWALQTRNTDEMWDKTDKVIRSILTEAHPDIKGYENVLFLSEINSPPSIDVLKKRAKHMVYTYSVPCEVLSRSAFHERHPQIFFEETENSSNEKEVRGVVAFSGTAHGAVRIVRKKEEIDIVDEGDILISPMTTPDYISAIKRAAAIVTDEGGIISHAAVISRELKKPCVIGTQNATEIFKNGDEVEVDAHNGVVRSITK